MRRACWMLLIFYAFLLPAIVLTVPLYAAPRVPAAALPVSHPKVQLTLRALDRLHSYGYSINTPVRADRAIRSWQRVNGLTVDGIVGSETAGSLGLTASVSPSAVSGAVRLDPPAAPVLGDPGPSDGNVEQIIRDVWPVDLADWAVRIATRESRLVPTVRNSCCWGLFQLNWIAHHAWMTRDFGVTDPHQLLDPRLNAQIALHLYEAAGPGPWSTSG